MKYSLIIPCYNEAKNMPFLIAQCDTIAKLDNCEVILVDNGSTDGSTEVIKPLIEDKENIRLVKVPVNLGYGHGITAGLMKATGDVLGWTHADRQTDPKDFLRGISLFEKHGSEIFVKGTRFGRPLGDQIFSIGMSIFTTLVLWKPFSDINAQPTMFSRLFFLKQKNIPTDFSLDLFFYYHAKAEKIKVVRFPVKFSEREFGMSHWNINYKEKFKFIKRTISFTLSLRRKLF